MARGDDGLTPMSFSLVKKNLLALKIVSTALNVESSSGGGRFERDHAEATFCYGTDENSPRNSTVDNSLE